MALAPYLANKEVLAEAIVTTVVLGLLLLVGPYYALFGRARTRGRSHATATRGDPLRVERVRPEARLPERPSSHTLGYTLYSAEGGTIAPGRHAVVRTGLRIGVPEGHVGLIVAVRPAGAFADLQVAPALLHPDSLQELALAVTNCSAETEAAVEAGDPIAHLTLLCAAAPPLLVTTFDSDRPRFVLLKRLVRMGWRLLVARAHEAWAKAVRRWKGPPPNFTSSHRTPAEPAMPCVKEGVAAEEVDSEESKAAEAWADVPDASDASDASAPSAAAPTSPISPPAGPIVHVEWTNEWSEGPSTSSNERYASPEVWRKGGRRRRNASTALAATASAFEVSPAASPISPTPSPTSSAS